MPAWGNWALVAAGHLILAPLIGVGFGLANGAWLGLADYQAREPGGSAATSMWVGAVIASVPFVLVWIALSLFAGVLVAALYPAFQLIGKPSFRPIASAFALSIPYLVAGLIFTVWWIAPMSESLSVIGTVLNGAIAFGLGWLIARYWTFGFVASRRAE